MWQPEPSERGMAHGDSNAVLLAVVDVLEARTRTRLRTAHEGARLWLRGRAVSGNPERERIEKVLRDRYLTVSLGEALDGDTFSEVFARIGAEALVAAGLVGDVVIGVPGDPKPPQTMKRLRCVVRSWWKRLHRVHWSGHCWGEDGRCVDCGSE